jgi:hypothetical protein
MKASRGNIDIVFVLSISSNPLRDWLERQLKANKPRNRKAQRHRRGRRTY